MDLARQFTHVVDDRPRLVIWETRPARDSAGRYGPGASGTELAAQPLSFAEVCDLIDQVAGFGTPRPSLLLTGDGPFQRPDLCDLVRYATRQALPVTISLSGTPLLTASRLQDLKDARASVIMLALDGSTPELHDGHHHMAGSFERTVSGARAAHVIGLQCKIVSTRERCACAGGRQLDQPTSAASLRSASIPCMVVMVPPQIIKKGDRSCRSIY